MKMHLSLNMYKKYLWNQDSSKLKMRDRNKFFYSVILCKILTDCFLIFCTVNKLIDKDIL